ncbi:protein adenylyltransferase Fic [Marilutibacter maris]|uniref:Protein adenylyltransferase n=1 Tax=Marilutibacter maris TaxID=1605891 RepID=A0A2U9TBQ5_9GAMM|nr:Fic family protein [Lysobacter maris]AWV08627.1 addiction module protein [Lysobacter maris]
MSFDPRRPYNTLPELPPAAEIESKPVLKACIEARAALAELKAVGGLIPSQAVLINTIPLLEAQASSEIENIVTTSDALFRFSQMEERADDRATKEALRYRGALHRGFQSIRERPLNTNTAVMVCSWIKGGDMQIRRVSGTALSNAATGEVIYTPPEGEALLREKLANWERFIHEATTVDPLVRMAVAHYQFEAIHPFLDGNGRTGRVLNLLMLVELGLLDQPVLYLSRHILRNRPEYYARLQAVTRDGAWEAWIGFMLAAVTDTARWTTAKVRAIRQLQAEATAFVKARAGKIHSRELVDVLFEQPYCRIQNLVEAGVAKRQTASVYLKQLVDIGMLREVRMGREKLFIHPGFVRLLTSDEHPVSAYGQD